MLKGKGMANPPILAPSQCKAVMASSPKLEDQKQCISMLLDSEISSGQAAKIKVGQTCLSDVCVSVCSSISGHGARTAGPIGTGVAPMDAPKRRNDDGAGLGSAGGTWHVARAAA